MTLRKSRSTIDTRQMVYDTTSDRSLLWIDMTLEQLKAEYLRLGHTPALCTEDRDRCLRYLYLAQMRRLVGN